MEDRSKPRPWSWLLLFTTSGTLMCCAIPITLVTLGMGATVASMASAFPWLIKMSLYKGWVFAFSGVLIVLGLWAIYRNGRTCPADAELAAACEKADRWNRRIIWLSVVLWVIGFFAAYVLPRIAIG